MRPRPANDRLVTAALLLGGMGAVAVGACGPGDPTGPAARSTAGTTPATSRPLVNPTIRLPRSPTSAGGAQGSTPGSFPPPSISGFAVDELGSCTAGEQTTTVVRYSTSGADRVVLVVDDVQLTDTPPLSGETTITLPCDSDQHYVAIIVANPADEIADDKRIVFGALP